MKGWSLSQAPKSFSALVVVASSFARPFSSATDTLCHDYESGPIVRVEQANGAPMSAVGSISDVTTAWADRLFIATGSRSRLLDHPRNESKPSTF